MTTFNMRIELTNLKAARKEYEALGAYLDYLDAEYAVAKDPIKQVEEKKEVKKPTPKPKPAPKAKAKPEPKEEVKEEVKEPEDAPTTEITHADIVALARAAVKATGDRTKVDTLIKRYGHPISKITENNFEAVTAELKKLVG